MSLPLSPAFSIKTLTTPFPTKHPVVLLFGPTAVGKTDLLLTLFEGKGEVVNADALQVYTDFNIGTAKPSPRMRSRLPHHLVDCRDPENQFHTGDFIRAAEALIPEILGRGKIPVISGGTAFYFKNYLYGLSEAPASNDATRRRLRAELDQRGLQDLYRELRDVDPDSADRIAPGDTRRILRALEVYRDTGKPLSAFPVPHRIRSDIAPLLIGLQRDRETLYRRIDQRVAEMFSRGLWDEVLALLKKGYTRKTAAFQAIGYREFFDAADAGCFSRSDIRDLIRRNTRRFAKRQISFFRRLPGVNWFNPEEVESIASAIDIFLTENKGGKDLELRL